MTVRQIKELLDAEMVCGEDKLDSRIKFACGSDLMSDVLAFVKDSAVLLTGLVNHHVIRTAEMLDIICVVFVRGKEIPEDIVELAKEHGLAVLLTKETLYTACGMIYAAGVPGGPRKKD